MDKKIFDSQKIYSRAMLNLYDFLVLGISNHLIWKCPTRKILNHFNENISSNHLDVGVGSGYYLNKGNLPRNNSRLELMDINENSLNKASNKIQKYNPICHRHNVLEKITEPIEPFDSISINYLLHCLPGNMDEKSILFDNLKHILTPNGIISGSTILPDIGRNFASEKLMAHYNKKGIFTNSKDSLEDLEKNLKEKFPDYSIDTYGCVTLFRAKNSN